MGISLPGDVSNFIGGAASRASNQTLEISQADFPIDRGREGLERADLIGQVCGSSPHGPTISAQMAYVYILRSASRGRYYVRSTSPDGPGFGEMGAFALFVPCEAESVEVKFGSTVFTTAIRRLSESSETADCARCRAFA